MNDAQQREAGEPRQQTALLTLAGSEWMCQERNQTVTLVDVFIRGYASDRGLLSYLISWGQCRSAYCSEQEKPSHVFHSRAGGPRRTEPFQLRTGGGQCNIFTIHKRYTFCSLVFNFFVIISKFFESKIASHTSPKFNFIVSVKGPVQVVYIYKDRLWVLSEGAACLHVITHAPSSHFYRDDKLTDDYSSFALILF